MLRRWGEIGPLRQAAGAQRRAPALRAARRAAVRQRPHPPRAHAQQDPEGHRREVAHHGRLARAVRPGLGLPRPADRAAGREGARTREEGGDAEGRGARALPRRTRRSSSTSSASEFERLGVLGDWEHPYLTMDSDLRGAGDPRARAVHRGGAALSRQEAGALVRVVRDRARRGRGRVRRRHVAVGLRGVPLRRAAARRRSPASPASRPRSGRPRRGRCRRTSRSRCIPTTSTSRSRSRDRRADRRRARCVPALAKAMRVDAAAARAAPLPRPRARGRALPAPVARPRRAGRARRLRHARERHRPRAHRARPRPGRLRDRPALRARRATRRSTIAGRFTADGRRVGGPARLRRRPEDRRAPARRRARCSPRRSYVHSYPHCWRCKKPIIFRATEQWFIVAWTRGEPRACARRRSPRSTACAGSRRGAATASTA